MQHDLQTWLIIILLALVSVIQLFIIAFLIRLSNQVKLAPGGPRPEEIAGGIMETMEGMHRAAKITTELLDQIRPTVEQTAIVSRRQLAHADQVIEEVLEDVERINEGVHDVATAVRFPFREAFALSAGMRSATATFFRRAANSGKRKQC